LKFKIPFINANLKRNLLAVLIIVILLAVPQIILYNEYVIDSYFFDSRFYYAKYTDVRNDHTINGYIDLRDDWAYKGLKSGKTASPIFDPKYYIDNNPDLKPVIGNDYVKAFVHFKKHGINEGRISSPVFGIEFYREFNKDLEGLSNMQLLKHYVMRGISEGRKAHPSFDIKSYLMSHNDLKNKFKTDYRAALFHYLTTQEI
jgi:hypothetical protein